MSSTDPVVRPERQRLRERIWLPLLALAAGVAVLALSVPRFATAVTMVPPAGLAIPGPAPAYTPEELDRQVERQIGAVASRPTPTNAAVLSALSAMQARNRGYDTPEGKESLQRASAAARISLVFTPINPYVWTRLAHVEMLLNGPGQYPAEAFRMSVLAARYPRDLMPARLTLGVMLWPSLDNDTRRLLFEQIALAQRTMPWVLPRVALESDGAGIIRVALAADPEALAGFDRGMARAQEVRQ